jgi:aconitate hydratase
MEGGKMITLTKHGVFVNENGEPEKGEYNAAQCKTHTMAYGILQAHNSNDNMEKLQLKFDALVSPDNNYVNILQTARAGGLKKFPVPYVLSNCHNTLCAVGGTINEDDHVFGLDNVKKYGGIFVPPYMAVIHEYMREEMASPGKMILGSDSHTRYGALGTMGIGEGGGEIVKQLLGKTYDLPLPPVIAVKLTGTPRPGVGPHDVGLALVAATFRNNFNKNKILEFIGDGIKNLSVEYRMGIDVMTTESAALSSIWCTDDKIQKYLALHGREDTYRKLKPCGIAYYDGLIEMDLSQVECMMALPFHPSHAISIHEFQKDPGKYLQEVEDEGRKIKGTKHKPFHIMEHLQNEELHIDQALVSGCSGGLFENIVAIADILKDTELTGNEPALGINPASQPIYYALLQNGVIGKLIQAGVSIRPAICGPCFGVTDVPADNQLSVRHTTRNYPNREGSKPEQNQMAASILMDARSIAATMKNGGVITAASDLNVQYSQPKYTFNAKIYASQVVDCYNRGNASQELRMGPNIADWPQMYPLEEHLLLKIVGTYQGSVTTDELIPSGEPSSYRSNPEKISEFTLINKDPGYVAKAKTVRQADQARRNNKIITDKNCGQIIEKICRELKCTSQNITIGSIITSNQIGDGSSREQAASCQKVLGGFANLANEYATKRYRSNLLNWGILPLTTKKQLNTELKFVAGDYLFIKNIHSLLEQGAENIDVMWIGPNFLEQRVSLKENEVVPCSVGSTTKTERDILLAGSLINYYGK